MSKRLKRNVFLFTVSMIAGGVFFWAVSEPTRFELEKRTEAVPAYWEIPAFSLENAHGGTLGRDDLLGKYWVADLIYTTCDAECPMMTRRMRRLQEVLPSDAAENADDVRLVSISVDPSNDSAQILRDYAAKERANPKRWFFLRGDVADVRRLAVEGFKLQWTDEDPLQHSQRLILVDPKGRVRGFYEAADEEKLEELRRDLAWLREHEGDAKTDAPNPEGPRGQ